MTTDAPRIKAGPVTTAAVIGCGKRSTTKEGWAIGHSHGWGLQQAIPGLQLYAVDPNPENLAAFGERFGLPPERLFASTTALYAALTPDLVSICTWPALHCPQVLEAARAGVRGIVCEKPMALDGNEIQEMLAACAKAGSLLAVAHQRAYDGEFITAKELLDAGVLGRELVLEARVGDNWDMLSWSVHWMDMASWLFSADATSVLAGVAHTGQRRYQHAVEDASVVFAEFPDQRQALFVTGPALVGGTMFAVRGTEGMMHVQGDGVHLWTKAGYREIPKAKVELPGFAGLVRDLADALATGNPSAGRCDAHRTSKATLLAFAAQESARTMTRITLPTHIAYPPMEIAERGTQTAGLGRVVVVADPHHIDPQTRRAGHDGLIEAIHALHPSALHVVMANERELTAADLADADLVVIYHTQTTSSPATREALSAWVHAGKPLAVVHCGIGAYPDWPEFRAWIGHYWVWGNEPTPQKSGHPHEPCTIEVVNPQWPVPWTSAWLPRDEVYIHLGQASEVRMLAVAKLGAAAHPVAWQSVQHPNVAVWAPGHRADMWRLPALRTGLAATIALVSRAV